MAEQASADPDQTLALLADMAAAADRQMAALAARLAGRLALDLARAGASSAGGVGRLEPGRADLCSGDIDIDRSLDGLLEARAAGRAVALDELWVQRWQRPATAITLVVDRSGSMGGPRLAAAAVAAAACALRAPQQWSALAFGDQVLAIKSADRDRPATAVVDDVLRLRGYGTTDLAAALDAARAQLERCTARRRVTVLLSDCRATAGGDPVAAARRLDELCVIAPAGDAADAEAFAAAAGARFAAIAGPRSIPDAVTTVLQA
ncbi:MAG: VWA domain-containing protein [Acidimicrobiaceae bacterium]|nr:VWA domain-containing protein [Acidimicrobiaceae bacterium]